MEREITQDVTRLANLPVYEKLPQETEREDTSLTNTQTKTLSKQEPAEESQDLHELKEALKYPYNPQKKTNDDGNTMMLDPHQYRALEIIAYSQEEDVSQWLKNNIGQYDPVFIFAMANHMAQQRVPLKEVFFWYSLAQLRGQADKTLCKDHQVREYLTELQDAFLKPLAVLYAQNSEALAFLQDKKAVIEVMKEAVSWDLQHPQTNSPDWICKSGYAVWSTKTYPQDQ